MFQPEKTKAQKASSLKEKTAENKRWDHDKFDQVQQEDKNPKDEKFKNSQKNSSRHQKQAQEQANPSDKGSSFKNPANPSNMARWTHDKYEEGLSMPSNPSEGNKRKDQKRARKEKKPDRQLYNVRRKQGKNSSTLDTDEGGRQGSLNDVEENIKGADYERPTASNMPVVLPDRLTSNEEEVSQVNNTGDELEKEKEKNVEVKGSSNEDELEETIEIVLKTERGTVNIKLSENEEDFEKVLNEICEASGISGRMELCFKINMLQSLQNVLKVPHQNLNSYLDNLLNENYNLILSEIDSGEPNDILSRYLDDENQDNFSDNEFLCEYPTDSPRMYDFSSNPVEIQN